MTGRRQTSTKDVFELSHFATQVKLTVFNFGRSGTLALSPERQSARMSEIKNGRFGLYGAEHSNCNHVMTLGSKGLLVSLSILFFVCLIWKVIFVGEKVAPV